MAEFKVGFCISGKGRLFAAALNQKARLAFCPTVAFLDETACPSLEELCHQHGVRVVRCDSVDRKKFDKILCEETLQSDLDLLMLTFNKLIPEEMVLKMEGKIINVHMSLLPAFPGFGALKKAVQAGVRIAGATLHQVTTGIDNGPIVAQCAVAVDPKDNEDSLGFKIYQALEPLYLEVLKFYALGRVELVGNLPSVRNALYQGSLITPTIEPQKL